jgi:thiamine biosynthesis lipoprotein
MNSAIDRRKFVAISAAAAGLSALPFGARAGAAGHMIEWRGTCLGGVATLRLHHPDESAAKELVRQAVSEAHRLEDVFSLYREKSALCQLNRHGFLANPPGDLSDLLSACNQYWEITGGVFDPTVQALWRCYEKSFSTRGRAPTPAERSAALDLVGWSKVRFDRNRVVLARAGMGLTLNGIAQGYITDRILERLRAADIESCIVDMGEIGTLGSRPDGHPWEVAVEDADGKATEPLSLVDKAVATSGAYGFRFDAEASCNHLFIPQTGECAAPRRTISVVADAATAADALSTAFTLMSDEAIGIVLAGRGQTQAYAAEAGRLREVKSAPGVSRPGGRA